MKEQKVNTFIFTWCKRKFPIRLVAYKTQTTKWYHQIENNKSYCISKATISENNYNDQKELQVILTPEIIISPLKNDTISPIKIMLLLDLTVSMENNIVDTIGCIVERKEVKRIMRDRNIKNILIVMLRDEAVHCDATFWNHIDCIMAISDKELTNTIISIQGATINVYQQAVTLNIGASIMIEVNPQNEQAERLLFMEDDTAKLNLSNILDTPSDSDSEYPPAIMIAAIKRDFGR